MSEILFPQLLANLGINHPLATPTSDQSTLPKRWSVAEKQAANNAMTLDVELLENQTFPITELLKAIVPDLELPPFIPDSALEQLSLKFNLQQQTFNIQGELTSEWTLDWGLARLKSNKIAVSIENSLPENQQQPQLSISLAISSVMAAEIAPGFTITECAISFSYQEGGSWSAQGELKVQLLDAQYQLGLSLSHSIEEQNNSVWRLTLNGSVEQDQSPLAIAGVCALAIPSLSLEISQTEKISAVNTQTTNSDAESGWEINLHAEGKLTVEIPTRQTFAGQLELKASNDSGSLSFEMEEGEIVIPLNIPNQSTAFFFGLSSLEVSVGESDEDDAANSTADNGSTTETDNTPWKVSVAAKAGFRDLPEPFAKIFPEEVEGSVEFSNDGLEVSVSRLFNPLPIPLSSVDLDSIHVELGTLYLDANHLTVGLTKDSMSLAIDLGVGIPNEWNKFLGTDSNNQPLVPIFVNYRYDEQQQLRLDDLRRIRFSINSTKGLTAQLLDSPFSFVQFRVEDDKTMVDINLGEAGEFSLQLPQFAFDGYQFTASGSMSVKAGHELKMPLQPVKKLLAAQGLTQLAGSLPDMLPINDLNLINADGSLQVAELTQRLQKATGFALPTELNALLANLQGHINRLPADLLTYLRFVVPNEFAFDISVTVDGGAKIKIKAAEETPLCMLLPHGPQLIGIRLRSFTFGEILSGTLFLVAVDADIDVFDPFQLCLTMLPTETIGLKKLADSHQLRRRLSIHDFMTFIVYQTQIPIPVPLFYEKIGLEVLNLDGSKIESEFRFPAPKFNAAEIIKTLAELVKFFSNPDYLLDTTQQRQLDLKAVIGKNYLQLPSWVSSNEVVLGSHQDMLTLSAYNGVAALMNAIKKLDPALLLTAIPLSQRMGSLNFELLGVQSQGHWLITTCKEFNNYSYQSLQGLTESDAKRLVANLQTPVAQISQQGEGLLTCWQGYVNLAGGASLLSRHLLITGNRGVICQFYLNGTLSNLLNLNLEGSIAVNLDSNVANPVVADGLTDLKVFGVPMFKGRWKINNNEIILKNTFAIFPMLGINLAGEFSGQVTGTNFYLGGEAIFSLAGWDAGAFSQTRLELTRYSFLLHSNWLGQQLQFELLANPDSGSFYLRSYLSPINAGGMLFIHAVNNSTAGACAFIGAENGSIRVYIDGMVSIPVLQLYSATKVDFSAQGISFYSRSTLGRFNASVKGYGQNLFDLSSITLEGNFENDLFQWISSSLTEQIVAINQRDTQNLNNARSQLNQAQYEVARLLQTVEEQRWQVNWERQDAQNRLAAAQADVNHAQYQVNTINNEISLHDNWYNSLPDWDWRIWIATKARDWGWYISKRGALLIARDTATAALQIAQGVLNLCRSTVAMTPVDLDPRVSGPLAAYYAANTFLESCQQTVNLLEQGLGTLRDVSIFLVQSGQNGLVVVEDVRFKGNLDALRGAELPVNITLLFMGQRTTLSLVFDLDEPHKLIGSLFNALIH